MSGNSNETNKPKQKSKSSSANRTAPTAKNLLELLKEIKTDKVHIRTHRNDDPKSTNIALNDLEVHVQDINTLVHRKKSVPTPITEHIEEIVDTTKYIRNNRPENPEMVELALDNLETKITELQSLIENHEEELKT